MTATLPTRADPLPEWMTTTGPLDVSSLRLPDPDAHAHRDLYVRDGSRFVKIGTEPTPQADEDLPPGWRRDPTCPARVLVPAEHCPHGHFQRWAERNCCATGSTGPTGWATALSDAHPCTGHKTTGDPCGRRTTYRDRHDRPACHSHGGQAA